MLFDFYFNYWVWVGIIYLIFLTFKSYKDKSFDEGRNYFMMGVTLSLFSHIPRNLWFVLGFLVVVIILGVILNKYKLFFGKEGSNTIIWMASGWLIINIWKFVFFMVWLCLWLGLFHLLKWKVFKYSGWVSNYGVYLVSFFTAGLFMGVL